MTRSATAPLVIGVTEYVDIPAWRILRLRAKIDTGARSSALHVENIRELSGGRVRFDVRLSRSEHDRRVTVEARIARRGQVRPSSGEPEERIFVAVKVRIGPVEREIELSLVDRGRMIFRMLIGRRALAHEFLVDPGRRYLLRQPSTRPSAPPKAATKSASKPAPARPATVPPVGKRRRERLGS
ncbi:MAG TPA: RimK/LysX family protein [Polyangiaceae bacterium]|nr:RimK/LysX family protein [Polyangiaceae bacterium]